jgi:hypothetical protein
MLKLTFGPSDDLRRRRQIRDRVQDMEVQGFGIWVLGAV